MLYSLDIETAPAEEVPEKVRERYKEKLALIPQYSRITRVGLVSSSGHRLVFQDVGSFKDWFDSKRQAESPEIGPMFVGHRLSFDLDQLRFHDMDIPLDHWTDDTRVMAHVYPFKVTKQFLAAYSKKRDRLNARLPKGISHRAGKELSLKVLAPFWLKVPAFWEDPADHANDEYVLKDCQYTLDLYLFLKEKLQEDPKYWAFYQDQMLKEKMYLRMKWSGIGLNKTVFEQKEAEYKTRLAALKWDLDQVWYRQICMDKVDRETNVYYNYSEKCKAFIQNRLKDKSKANQTRIRYKKMADKAINKLEPLDYESPTQMLNFLKNQLGYDTADFKGKDSTGIEVLERLAGEGLEDIKLLIKYRKCSQICKMYFPSYRMLMRDWKIHATFDGCGTRTGRLSSSMPNLQQVPPELYCLFEPPKGYSFVQQDAEAIEAKLIGLYSGDKKLYEIVSEGHSVHAYRTKYVFFQNSSIMAGCEVRDVKKIAPKEYAASKQVGFARYYGSGFRQTKQSMQKHGFNITDKQAKSMWLKDRAFFKGATQFHEDITSCFEKGDVIFNILGRPIRIQNPKDAYMKGMNMLMQSSASDLNSDGCYQAEQVCLADNLPAFPVALIHDANLWCVRDDHLHQVDNLIVDKMTGYKLVSDNGVIPLTVEGKSGKVWTK